MMVWRIAVMLTQVKLQKVMVLRMPFLPKTKAMLLIQEQKLLLVQEFMFGALAQMPDCSNQQMVPQQLKCNYGYLEDGVYKDGGRFLTVKGISSGTVITFEERIGHNAGSSNTCNLKLANDHIVYRQLTTQARPNGDWEKWKGDFKGTNTRPGRGPTMNNYEQSTYERLGK